MFKPGDQKLIVNNIENTSTEAIEIGRTKARTT